MNLITRSAVTVLINTCSLSLALAPDSSLVVICSSSDTFEVHDIASHCLIQALPRDTPPGFESQPVAFAHDGFAIVTRRQGKASIWDIEYGDKLQVLNHGGKQIYLIKCSLMALIQDHAGSALLQLCDLCSFDTHR